MKRLAIVTGASRGIGRETALLLAQERCDLLLTARSDIDLERVAKECREFGVKVTTKAADLSDPACCSSLIEDAQSSLDGAYLVLINVAGVAEFGSFDQQPFDVFLRHVHVNYLAAVSMCHAALPLMLEKRGGQIINVLSIAATHAFSGAAAYCSSKAALQMFTKVLALEYRARGIRVSSVIPGSTDTALWDKNPWKPPVDDMLPVCAVAEAIRDVVMSPLNRNFDEVVLMPPNGIL